MVETEKNPDEAVFRLHQKILKDDWQSVEDFSVEGYTRLGELQKGFQVFNN